MEQETQEITTRLSQDGRVRVVIESVTPEIDAGRFPIKRIAGDEVVVEADIFADGHDAPSAVLLYRKEDEGQWREAPMEPLANDRWRCSFQVNDPGRYHYTIVAWVDRFKSWREGLAMKDAAGQVQKVDLLVGAELIAEAAARSTNRTNAALNRYAAKLRSASEAASAGTAAGLSEDLAAMMAQHSGRDSATAYGKELSVIVDRERARYSTWYEVFPRSCSPDKGRHGTFKDCQARLPYFANMGFDVLYLPPIHPIGRTHRKGKNNVLAAEPQDPGSPWSIGAREGGHKAIHPELGTLEDFRELVGEAKDYGMEIALDIAFQCAPDHPYVTQHPEWFRHRPDGSIQYAENPPKRYEDIYPFDFECENWEELWDELKSVFHFWIEQGVYIFRVDNPHTKAFAFWEWVIGEIKRVNPEVLFLSEAFTRPKVMYRLTKLGFTQSYTYFAWRNAKWELEPYFTELTRTDVREHYRPNLWPNTPDILTEYLQFGGRPAFMARLVLAATLGASYGIYGPAFELGEDQPREPGSEEYLDSEKYQVRLWDLERPDSLAEFVGRMNGIRRANPALQSDWSLRFHPTDNEQIICYSKRTDDRSNAVLVVVNLDPHHTHSGSVHLSLEELGLNPGEPFQVHDLLSETRYLWRGPRNHVELNPQTIPARIFRVRRQMST